MLAVEELERAGYQTVLVATPDTQGRPVGRQLPLRRFLEYPLAGVEISSYSLVYDLAGIPLQDSPFTGAKTGYHDIHLRPDLSTLRPLPGVSGLAICLADAVDAGLEIPLAPRAMLKRQVQAARNAGFKGPPCHRAEVLSLPERPAKCAPARFSGSGTDDSGAFDLWNDRRYRATAIPGGHHPGDGGGRNLRRLRAD